MMPKIFGFDQETAGRIGAAVKRFERYYRTQDPVPPRAKYPIARGLTFFFFKAGAGGVPAGAYNAPGNAMVTLLTGSGTSAALATTATSIKAYNVWQTAVGANRTGFGVVLFGYNYVLAWDC